MSSQQCRHHGRPPPAPDPIRRTSSQYPQQFEYEELYELQRQTAALNARLAAFASRSAPPVSNDIPMTHSSSTRYQDWPTTVTRSTTPNRRASRKKRNPMTEGSNHRFYAVKNGTNGNEVFSSWTAAAPYCWDHQRQYFHKGTICKGFPTYDEAWNWILNIPTHPNTSEASLLPSPPRFQFPSEPPVHIPDDDPYHPIPDLPHQELQSGVISSDWSSSDSSTNTYEHDLKPPAQAQTNQVPQNIDRPIATSSVSYTEYSDDPTPFISSGGNKALPKYSGKKSEDINAFFYKLRIFFKSSKH